MSYSVDQLQAGQTASFSKTITEHDVYTFAGVTGDLNPAILMSLSPGKPSSTGELPMGCCRPG